MITKLKSSLMSKSEKINFTTFEVLAGYMWRSRARALKLSNNDKTMLNMLVGGAVMVHKEILMHRA